MKMKHIDGSALEEIVRNVYGCEYAGLCGMAFSDNFEAHPLEAAILCLAKLGDGLEHGSDKYNKAADFLSIWRSVFEYPDEAEGYTAEQYIEELQQIVNLLRS